MIDGYLKVAAITPNVRVADVEFNCNEIWLFRGNGG